MPLSGKGSKKTSSKEQLSKVVETQASTSLKCKANRGNIISNLFGRSKLKTKGATMNERYPPSLTCLYANTNTSEQSSSCNISSIQNEVVEARTSKGVVVQTSFDAHHKAEIDKSVLKVEEKTSTSSWSLKGAILNKLKRKSTDEMSADHPDTVLYDESYQQSQKENITGLSQSSALNCDIPPDIPTITVLKEVLQFGARLQDSEYHLIQVITKYLEDDSLEKELIDMVSNHTKLQVQVERRSQALACAMWKQQSDLYKSQEKTLTENLKEMVWQNRKLQEENELLMKRMDTTWLQSEMSSSERNGTPDRLHHSNERLRFKISNLTQQLHELESNLLDERGRSGMLEEQFSACFVDLQTEKANIQTIKMDHQLEMAYIRQELDAKDEIVKGAIQTGDALMGEIERAKKENPSLFDTANWEEQNSVTNPLSNIMAMSRYCLGIVVDRILQLQADISTVRSERDHFKNEALRLQKTAEATSEEIVALMKQTDLLNAAILEKEEFLKRINHLDREKMALENELKGKILQLEEIKAEKVFMVEGIHQVKDIVHANEDQLKCIKAENETLMFQNKSLSQILMQSGSGDVARELACSQEKLQMMQSHYYQMVAQKEQLEEKLKVSTNEVERLKSSNAGLTDKLNLQAETISDLNESKLNMKEELAGKEATLAALQNERRRHLAEKNFLRTIYDKIQNDASKTESLEGSLSEVSKEADRLAVIAEFNKQLGERFQNELHEKDEVIHDLKESIKSLNSVQQVNVKEKVALCEELTEICSIKEVLAKKLEMEVQKSYHITESAKETECSVTEELKALKEMQKIERAAVKELLEDFNVLVTQRDRHLKYKMELEKQLEHMEKQASCYQEELTRREKDVIEKEEAIVWLDKQLKSSDEKMRCLTDKVESALKKQLVDIEALMNDNNKLTSEREKFKTSIEYLKSNIHNLQDSLDYSRKTENEYRKLFEAETEKYQALAEELKESNAKNLVATEELAISHQELTQLKKDYDRVFTDHQDLLKAMPQQEEMLQRYKSMENFVDESQDELRILKETVTSQTITIGNLEKENQNQSSFIQSLTSEESKLRGDLVEVVAEKVIFSNKFLLASTELEKVKTELIDRTKLVDEKTKNQQHLERSCVEAQTHIKDLMETLHNADEKNVKLKNKLDILQNMYRTLDETHRKLAGKLLKTVHSLMSEKIARKSAETNSDQLTKRIATTELEKNDFLQKLKIQHDTIKNQEKKIVDFEAHKNELEEKLKEAVSNYHMILGKYDEIIREFAATEVKCKGYEIKLEKYLSNCPNCKDMEERMCNLQNSLDSNHDDLAYFQNTIANLKLSITSLEFERSENKIHLHDVERRLEVERTLREECEEATNRILTKTLELKEEEVISKSVCEMLLSFVHGAP